MKIRNGFVSNSSSSSFIVLLKNKLKTKDEINEHNEKMLNEYGPVLSEKILKNLKMHKQQNDFVNDRCRVWFRE